MVPTFPVTDSLDVTDPLAFPLSGDGTSTALPLGPALQAVRKIALEDNELFTVDSGDTVGLWCDPSVMGASDRQRARRPHERQPILEDPDFGR